MRGIAALRNFHVHSRRRENSDANLRQLPLNRAYVDETAGAYIGPIHYIHHFAMLSYEVIAEIELRRLLSRSPLCTAILAVAFVIRLPTDVIKF